MNIFILGFFFFSLSGVTATSISPIYDGEFNMDGKACWVANSSDETLIHDDDKNGRVKVGNKIIELTRTAKSATGSFECDKTFVYESRDKKISALVKLPKKDKTGKCLATIEVTIDKARTVIPPQSWYCSN